MPVVAVVPASPEDLSKFSVGSIPGIDIESKRELQNLGLGSAALLIDFIESHGGDLTKASTDCTVIEVAQADRIMSALLAWDKTPASFKAHWKIDPLPVVQPVVPPVQPPASNSNAAQNNAHPAVPAVTTNAIVDLAKGFATVATLGIWRPS